MKEVAQMTVDDAAVLFGDEAPGATASRSISIPPRDPIKDPLTNKLRNMRDSVTSCPQLWAEVAKLCPDKRALLDAHMCDDTVDLTFAEMHETVLRSASVFKSLGVKKGVNIAILGENSARWLMADHGIQMAGGASAVRGADAPLDELRYIYEHSDSAGVAVIQGPRLLQKLAKDASSKGMEGLGLQNAKYGAVKTVVLLHREKKSEADIAEMSLDLGIQVLVLESLIEETKPLSPKEFPVLTENDLATIVYTSGTTGRPKGVMLTQGNLLHQISHRLAPSVPYEEGDPCPGEKMLSLLPVWHITERTFELWMISRGCHVVYSSIRTFRNDLAKHTPEWMVLVPRVLEKVAQGAQDKFAARGAVTMALVKFFTAIGDARASYVKESKGLVVSNDAPNALKRLGAALMAALLSPLNFVGTKLIWSKIQAGFGGKVKVIISGGSALAGGLEKFYEVAGLNILVGYGLTECAPLIAFRRADSNLVTAGCAGKAVAYTELRVVDPALKGGDVERPALPDGEAGVVLARGPQVMRGYYKNPEATAEVVDRFGWFNTGDLGRINGATGDLILTGRAKDTIVLSNGENIEPSPIEDAIMSASPLIEQVMLTGQDGRRLVAIAVLNPTELMAGGYLSKKEASELQSLNEMVNDPKCTEEDCESGCAGLKAASVKLRNNAALRKALLADMKVATRPFRAWEQVGEVYVTLEPFAMANGQLTQSYKVKRAGVMERYGNELPN